MYIPKTEDNEATRMFHEYLSAVQIDKNQLRKEDYYLLKTTFFTALAMVNQGIEIKAMKDESIKNYLEAMMGGVHRFFQRSIN